MVDSSYLCFFLIITWPSGVSLYKCYSHHTQWRLKHFFLAICRGINIRQIWPAKAQHHQVNYSRNKKAWWQTLEPWVEGHLWDRENLIGSSSLDRIETKSAGVALFFRTEIACTYIMVHLCVVTQVHTMDVSGGRSTHPCCYKFHDRGRVKRTRGSVYSSRIDMCISCLGR